MRANPPGTAPITMRKNPFSAIGGTTSRFGYRARFLALVAVASAGPLIVLAHPMGWGAAATVACVGSLVALVAIMATARPYRQVALALREFAGSESDQGEVSVDPLKMMGQLRLISARMEDLKQAIIVEHPVTGLATREPFLITLGRMLRGSDAPAILGAIRFIDYDKLAAFDPAAADRALAAFAARLKASVSKDRVLAQVDRDTFAIWLPDAREVSELQALAYVLSQDLTEGDMKLSPQIAVGGAKFPSDGDDPAVLLTRAMAALFEHGHSGGGPAGRKLAFFSAESSQGARERFALGQECRRALQRNQFSLHYQPVVDIKQSRVVGAEALIRWTHPELGNVPPSEFVPFLEQSGLMEEVGLWVLNTACREARQWQDQGLGDLTLAVNLSPVQCQDPNFGALVTRTLERHGLEPGRLELELTETAAMQDTAATQKLLEELRDLGVGVAIDDFGAGYSSLSYLKNLPFSKLKIDREFVTHIDTRRDSQAICSALVALAKGLDIKILAEGVERREELETLRSLNCPMIQGYYFSRPLPPAEFARTIADPKWLELLASPVHRQRALIDRRAGV
jgi:EAL domain-containing protein (putative c-di-GMP-specific phosphodiesterase class I)/GGDEF domain-containing protein